MKSFVSAIVLFACVLVLLAPSSPLHAQVPPSLGDTIRVTTASGDVERGTYQGLTGDRLLLGREFGAHREIPRSEVEQLDVLVGRERRFFRDFGLTMGIIAAGGGLGYAAVWSPCTDTGFLACMFHPTDRFGAFGMGALVGAAIGVPIGALVGLMEHNVWEERSLSGSAASRASLKLVPASGGAIGFSASVPLGPAMRVR